jgi:hypothetical protein
MKVRKVGILTADSEAIPGTFLVVSRFYISNVLPLACVLSWALV